MRHEGKGNPAWKPRSKASRWGVGRLLPQLYRSWKGWECLSASSQREKEGDAFMKHLRTDTAAIPVQGGGLFVARVTVQEGVTGRNHRQGHRWTAVLRNELLKGEVKVSHWRDSCVSVDSQVLSIGVHFNTCAEGLLVHKNRSDYWKCWPELKIQRKRLWANVDRPTRHRKCFISCRMWGRSFQCHFLEMERGFAYFSEKRSVKSSRSEFEDHGDSM